MGTQRLVTTGTPSPEMVSTVSTKLERIANLAKRVREPLTTLAHHIDLAWMREAYRRTRKDAAPGVDGVTGEAYAANLEENLEGLLARARSGEHYRAPPVRRVYIPKADGARTRPIGIPTFEDKVLQRAVVMVLDAVYEQEFLPCSYGCRPGKGAHDALEALREALRTMGGGFVLEADIESFFDSVDHAKLRELFAKRVRDGVLVRLVGKWLNAGVLEEGCVYHPETGTPQGGVISPLLANVYLHEVLDTWFEAEVRPRLGGRCVLVRYVDDFVIVFEREEDARRVLNVLPKRFGRYGLRLHPEKTRLVAFGRPPSSGASGEGPGSFDFLGFTHHWGRSRRGEWVVRRKTAKGRLARTLRRIGEWLREHRHDHVRDQHRALEQKLRGHDGYYGVTGNYRMLARLRRRTERLWHKWLRRRSSKSRLSWERMRALLQRLPLPKPRIVRRAMA
jgi:group II intron reverse transcriptase/maturase